MSETVAFSLDRRQLLARPEVSAELMGFRGLPKTWANEAYAPKAQIVFALEGLHLVDGGRDALQLDPTTILFIPAGQTTRDRHPFAGDTTCLILTLEEAAVQALTGSRRMELPGGWCALSSADPALQYVVSRAARPQAFGVAGEGLEEAMLGLAEAAWRAPPRRRPTLRSSSLRLVRMTKELVHSAGQPLTLSDIAGELGVTPNYLTTVFRRSEGVPIYRYQMRVRLARALARLARVESITELALDLGFSSHSHFTTVFRDVFGASPSEYRASTRPRTVAASGLRAAA